MSPAILSPLHLLFCSEKNCRNLHLKSVFNDIKNSNHNAPISRTSVRLDRKWKMHTSKTANRCLWNVEPWRWSVTWQSQRELPAPGIFQTLQSKMVIKILQNFVNIFNSAARKKWKYIFSPTSTKKLMKLTTFNQFSKFSLIKLLFSLRRHIWNFKSSLEVVEKYWKHLALIR